MTQVWIIDIKKDFVQRQSAARTKGITYMYNRYWKNVQRYLDMSDIVRFMVY
jgi:hypothetical protein